MPTNMFDEARRRVSSGTNASSTQNDNIFSQARSRVNTGQTVDTVPAITQRSAASPLPTRKKNLERIDLGQDEGKIGEGWQNRVNTESMIGESYKDTTAYYDRLLKQRKQQFEAVKPDSNFLQERQRLRNEIDRLEQEREAIDAAGKRGSFRKEGAGGFGTDSELHINPRSTMQTVADTIARGAGQFDLGLLKTADFAANAIPNVAGAIRGVDPEETFTGQLFKPITDATGQAVDWMQRGVENMNRNIQNDTQGNKAAQIAAEVGSGVVGAIPNAALAMMTGGASAGGAIGSQLAPQATGLSGTILSAWNKMVSSPMFQVSFAQTLGNSYDEAKQAGASDVDAMAAALLSTTANAMVEVGGGIETLPGEISGADLSSGKKALKWLTSALDEGKEEVVQGVISNMVNKAAGTDERPYFSMTDENAVLNPYRMGQEFAMGTAVGGIMGGGQVLADTVMNRSKAGKSALDFAIEETLKPTQEKSSLDRSIDSLFEQNKTAQEIQNDPVQPIEQKETVAPKTIAASPETGSGRLDATAGTDGTISQAESEFNTKWNNFLDKHNGKPTSDDFLEFARSVSDSEENARSFSEFLDNLEKTGKIKFNGSGAPMRPLSADDHIDRRDYVSVGDRRVNSFSFNNPELQPYIREGLQILGDDIANSVHGKRTYLGVDPTQGTGNNHVWTGQKRKTTPEIARLKDDYNMSWSDIDKAWSDLMEDSGKENNANAKRLELLVDDILTNGHKTLGGIEVGPNQEYIDAKSKIDGYTPKQKSSSVIDDAILETLFPGTGDPVGDLGAKTSDFKHDVKQSQAADAMTPGMDVNSGVMDHGTVGAAEIGFSPYSHYQNQTSDFLPEGANAARPVDMPAVDPTGKPVRRGAKTIYGAQTTSDARAEQMESEFMEGLYGYDPVKDKPTLEKAKQTIAQEGYDRAYARVKERLQSMKKLKETGLEAYLLYADAVKNGKDADAADLCLLLTQSGTEFAQGVQLFSMFRKLTPEGQMMGIERMVQRINNKYAGSDKETAIPDYARNYVIREITDVRDTALRLLENIQAVFDKTGQNHGVPVEDWIQEIGDRLAKSLEKTNGNSSQLTVSKTIQNDLRRFAKSYFDRKKPGNRYSNAQALENFLNNRDQYTEAWDEARWYLSNKYKNDPSMLDALNDFLTSGINIESIGSGIDTDIKKAMNDIGVKTKDIIRKSNADKDSTSKQIAEMLMKDHNLSNEDADTMANFIIDRFNQHISDASELVLKNRFAPKDKKAKKTFEQNFYELANMGAFTNENWKDAVSKKLFGHEISIDETLISEFLNAQDQDTRDAVMEKIYENIGKQIPTTASEAINQFRYTAMLLNPSTHIKNMGGNLSMMAMKLGKDAIGAGIEKVSNAVSGGKVGRTKSILNVFSKSDQALMQKAWSDFENVQDDVAGIGKNKDNVMGKVGEYRSYWKLNDPQGSTAKLVDGVLRGAEKVPQFNSKLMEAEDMIFSRPDYAVSLAGYMKANKLTEITPEARAYAIKEAQKATFRDANSVSNFARKIGTGDHKFWNWVANAIFPFKGTPANVGVRAFEYSPAGLLKALTYDIYRVKTGKISATEYIDNLSSGLTGSALAAVGYYLAQAGFLRATGVGDEKEKEQQREQGYKDNSFTLLGYSIPEMVLTSLSAPMFVGAAFYEALATKALSGEAYDLDDIFQVLAATADPIFGQTMLDGLSDTFYTIRSAQGGMGEVTSALALNTVGNYISSFMPTILSRISSAADSVGRETYVDKNKQMKGVQKEAQGLMMKTPARQLLHEKVDNYGRVQETWMSDENDGIAEKALKFAANVVTPSYPSKIKTSDVEDELSRLYHSGVDTSDKKVFQTEAAKYITVDGQKVNLTQDQHEQFEKTRGKNTMEYQGALQENSTYEKLDDDLKINATDKMYDFIEQTSKESLNIGYEPEQWVSDLKGKTKEEIADTIMLKTIESYVKSDSFSGKYDGITSMLESGNIDEAMAVSMLPKEAEDGYFNQIKGSGIEISTFIDVYQFKTDARSDYDKDGKTVKSAQEKVIEYINRVEKIPEKKRRLFLSMGYAESKIPEEWK